MNIDTEILQTVVAMPEPLKHELLHYAKYLLALRARVFTPTFTFEDDSENYGEQRWVTLGLLGMKIIVIVHTETTDEIRIISVREANKNEQLFFFRNYR